MKVLFVLAVIVFSYVYGGELLQKEQSVVDTKNHLEWQDTPQIDEYDEKWAMSKKHCQSLHIGGYSDWKMPTKAQLLLLSKYQEAKGQFRNLADQVFWSIDEDPQDDLNALAVYIGNGHVSTNDKCETNKTICVRTNYMKK